MKTLTEEIVPTNTELKTLIINYVGKVLNPEKEDITVEQIVEVFAEEFPEFLLALAQENWVNGYTQALNDLEYTRKMQNDAKEIYQRQE